MADILEPRRLYQELCDAGCNLFSRKEQNRLQVMLQEYEPQGGSSFSVVTRLGAFPTFYVRPDEIIGTPPLSVELATGALDRHMLQKYRCRGSVADWQKAIGSLCAGNSRLMFAASLACTGPILPVVVGPRTGGFQISGRAESGKTALAMVAGSIWGCHRDSVRKEKGFTESWNTTNNKLEETAQAHCDSLLVVDETNLAGGNERLRAEEVINGAFRLSEVTKKLRYNELATAAWRLYFLSTSNFTLAELAEAGGMPIDDQHRGRMVDIGLPKGPGTFGIFEELHGFSGGAELTDTIKARCRSVFGTPGRQFVRKLYKDENSRLTAKTFLKARRAYYIDRLRKVANSKGLKPLERATARFATVYATGCLAIKYGIFAWNCRDLLRAALSCQLDGLVTAESKTDQIADLLRKLADYLVENRTRFLSLDEGKLSIKKHEFGSVPGYAHTHHRKRWLYLTSDQLKAIIGTGKAADALKGRLMKQGVMASTRGRGLVQRPIFRAKGNKGYRWVHAFRVSLNSIEAP